MRKLLRVTGSALSLWIGVSKWGAGRRGRRPSAPWVSLDVAVPAKPASVPSVRNATADRRGEDALRAVDLLGEDRGAQRVEPRDRRDDRGREHGHHGDADAAEDRGQRERPLDLADDLKAAEALPAGGIDELGVDRRIPTYVFVRIGGIARSVRAKAMFRKPVPRNATQKPMIASAGTARPTFATPTASSSARPRWPSRRPIGTAMTIDQHDRQEGDGEVVAGQMAHLAEAADLHRAGIRGAPLEDEVDGIAERREDRAERERSCGRPPPRGQQPLDAQHDEVQRGGQQRQDDSADEDVAAEVDVGVDVRPEAARTREIGERGEADGRRRGDPQPGDDLRQRERKLDAKQQLAAR